MEFITESIKNFMPENEQEKAACQKKFVDSFVSYVRSIFEGQDQNSANMKYKLRQDLLTLNSIAAISGIQYKGRTISSLRLDRYQQCVRLTVCDNYHFFGISEIFKKMCETKTPTYQCPSCKKTITKTTEIIPDYLSYLYFTITQGVSIALNFDREPKPEISEDEKSEIYRSSNKIYHNQNIVSITFENYSSYFKKAVEPVENQFMLEIYKRVKSEKDVNGNMRVSNNITNARRFETLGTTSFGIISLINGKRMKAGVLHEDCKHDSVYIFDLEGVILSLFMSKLDGKPVEVKTSVKCLFCDSAFTQQNILQKAVLFNRVNTILLSEPFSCGRIIVDNNKIQYRGEDREFIKKEERLRADATKKYGAKGEEVVKKKLDLGLTSLVTKSTAFWNAQERDKYEKYSKDAVAKMKKTNPDIKQHFLTIDYKKMFYPVRCRSCNTLNCLDLWQHLIQFVRLWDYDLSDNYNCIVCKKFEFNDDESEPQKFIYMDLEIYTLMQFGLLNIGYYFSLERWLPDIREIAFKENSNMNALTFVVNFLKNNGQEGTYNRLGYYKREFSIKEADKNSSCFILNECNNLPDDKQKFQHVIFISRQTEVCRFQCPKCHNKPSNILDLIHDGQLQSHIKQGYADWNHNAQVFVKASRVLKSSLGKSLTKSKIRLIDDGAELESIKRLFAKEIKKIEDGMKGKKTPGWDQTEISEYAGGVGIFADEVVEMLQIA